MDLSTDDGTATETYSLYRTEGTRAVHTGPNHSDLKSDMAIVSSTNPKGNGTTYGNRRSSVNYVRSITVPTPDGGSSSKDAKVELVCSLPAGASTADISALYHKLRGITLETFESIIADGKIQH